LECRLVDRGADYVVLGLSGGLLGNLPSARIRHALEEHYLDDGVRRIRLDLRGLATIDLEGVGFLIQLFRESQRRGKSLTVERARGSVRDRLRTTGILRFLERPG